MQAFVIFLLLAGLLVAVGLFYPTHTRKTPQNDRQIRQGDTIDWLKEVTGREKNAGSTKEKSKRP